MKSKEKEVKNIVKLRLTIKRIMLLIIVIIILVYAVIVYNMYFGNKAVFANSDIENKVEELKISTVNKINIEEILKKKTEIDYIEEYIQEELVLEYTTTYIDNSELPKGVFQVIQEGRQGIQKVIIKKTYNDEELINEEQVSNTIIKASVNKIVHVGTKQTNIYEPKIGEIIYVTSDRLELKYEPSEDSEKIMVLGNNQQMKVEEILDNWYKVFVNNKNGYVKKESTTNISSQENIDEAENNVENPNINSNISFNIDLSQSSGLSLEQFTQVLTDSKDINNVFKENAKYFYYIEQQYQINGLFLAAVAIHESGWATSQISKDKNNLFGYGAYDGSPYESAYSFDQYSEGIDLLARVFIKYYLNPSGTNIYNGEIAVGTYYNGATLSGVNTRYATDSNWANAVYNHMKYLYNKL